MALGSFFGPALAPAGADAELGNLKAAVADAKPLLGREGDRGSAKLVACPPGGARRPPWTARAPMLVMRWGPALVIFVFALTLGVTIATSVALLGDSNDCAHKLCDISVYGAYPPHGAEETVFRLGFSLLSVLCGVVAWARYRITGNAWPLPFWMMGVCALNLMAWIPCYESSNHIYAALGTFVFLGIGEWTDASMDYDASILLTFTRKLIIVTMLGLFGFWYYVSMYGDPKKRDSWGFNISLVEYAAATMPFTYLLSWSYQQRCCDTPPGSTAKRPRAWWSHLLC